jgi:hypothetical protein
VARHYLAGELAWHDGILWQCWADDEDPLPETFDEGHWTAVLREPVNSGLVTSWVSPTAMSSTFSGVTGPRADGFGVGRNAWTLPKSGDASIFASKDVPAGWSSFDVDLWCFSSGTGGKVSASFAGVVDGPGSDLTKPVQGAATRFLAEAPTKPSAMTVRTIATGFSTPTAGGVLNAYLERHATSDDDTANADLRVHGLMLRRTA